nr:MAG TPA: hypothetical protein [Caudoviricetes sp.]
MYVVSSSNFANVNNNGNANNNSASNANGVRPDFTSYTNFIWTRFYSIVWEKERKDYPFNSRIDKY